MCWILLFYQPSAPSIAQAETASPSQFFRQGKISFKKGNFAQALDFFKQAKAGGLKKPALFYNIGVCAYKLELFDEANEAFLHTATFPQMAALAYYNLGVVAEKQDDTEMALSWFEKSIAIAGPEDDKILLLAQTALSRIQMAQGLVDRWTSYAALGFGYDDNVSMIESNDLELVSEEEDSFTDFFAFVRSPFLRSNTTEGPFIQGTFSFRDYTDLNEYDVGTLNIEGKYRKKIGSWRVEGGAGYNYILWDDSSYSQSPIVNLRIKHPSGWRLSYQAKYLDLYDSDYYYLKGWQHRATTEFVNKSAIHNMTIGYRFEENHRRNEDYSPRRHLITAQLELYPVDNLCLTMSASFRDSFYDRDLQPNRRDDRYESALQLGYTLTQYWEITARYTRTVNHSSDDLYDYRRDVTSLSLGYTF